ncbi:hypothetical protein JCM3770_005956 [Rhodotorula araucariae]
MRARLVCAASTRAVLAAAAPPPALLDAAAPAASTAWASLVSRQLSTTKTSPAAAASSAKVRLETASSRPTGSPKPHKRVQDRQCDATSSSTAAPRPSHPTQKPSPSSPSRTARRPSAPSASDLLSELRRASASSRGSPPRHSRPPTASAQALTHVAQGLQGKRRDFARAFLQGWVPLRRAGQAGRVSSDEINKLLQAVAKEAKDHPERLDEVWADIRDLVLYAAGERDLHPVTEWAWKTLELGWAGAERVADVYDALRRGAHRALRSGADSAGRAPAAAARAPLTRSLDDVPADTAERRVLPAQLFAAYLAARALLRTRTRPPGSAASTALVPLWAGVDAPPLAPLLARGTAQTLVARHVPAAAYACDALPLPASPSAAGAAAAHALVERALRQAALAQLLYARRDAPPGVELLAYARDLFRTGRAADAWALWGDVVVAVDGADGDEGWLATDGWDKSGRERRLRGEVSSVEAEAEAAASAIPDEASSSGAGAQASPAAASEHLQVGSATVRPAGEDEPLPPASLHQAVIATFIGGFVQAQATEHANAIWSWLLSHSPPLVPGVVCWTGLLHGYAARGEVHAVEVAFGDLQRSGVEPDLWAWLERIDAHFAARSVDAAMRLAREMMRDKALVRQRGDAPLPEEAWNRLIGGLLANGRRTEAEALLDEMRAAGVPPSIYTVNAFLRSYTRGSKPDLAAVVRVLKLISELDLDANVFTFTMVLQALLAGGLKDATARTIAIMERARVKPTATTYSAIIADLCASGSREHLDAAVQLLDEMESKRIATNEIVYTSLIQGFLRAIPSTPLSPSTPVVAGIGAAGLDSETQQQHPYFVAALALKQRMEKRGLRLNRIGYNAFLGAALALQSAWGTEFALRLFGDMQRKRATLARPGAAGGDDELSARAAPAAVADTWYILVDGFVRMGDFVRAEAVVHEMRRSGFEVRSRGLQQLVNQVLRGHP